jgi:hypothetical protein
MAYVANQLDDEDENEQGGIAGGQLVGQQSGVLMGNNVPQGGQAGAQGPQTSRGVGNASGGSAGGGQGGAAQASKGSGAWTNLNKYLEANQGAGRTMAGTVAQGVDKRATDAKTAGAQLETDTVSAIDTNTVKRDTGLEQRVKSDPVSVARNEQAHFAKIHGASYGGPDQVDATKKAEVDKQIRGVKTDLEDYGSNPGQQRLLRDTFASPKYTQGENLFDAFLVGTDGGQTLADSRARNQGFDSGWDGLNDRVAQRVATARTETDAAREGLRGATSAARDQVAGKVNIASRDAARKNAANDKAYRDLISRAQGGDDSAFQEMGFAPGQASRLLAMGFRPEQIISDARNLSLADVVDDDTRARLSALQELSGESDLEGGFDFGERGGSDRAFEINEGLRNQAQDFDTLLQNLDGRVTRRNSERAEEAARLDKLNAQATAAKQALTEFENAWAKDTKNMNYEAMYAKRRPLLEAEAAAREAYEAEERRLGLSGLDLRGDELKRARREGRKVDRADVLTDSERTRFAELFTVLGIPGFTTQDAGDEGAGVSYDLETLRALSSMRKPTAKKGTTAVVAPQPVNTRTRQQSGGQTSSGAWGK